MGGKIQCYVDCVSPFSHYAFKHLLDNRSVLANHEVEVDFIPFFLGGVMQSTGNQPPWTNPAKGKYGVFDRKRACKQFGVPFTKPPSFFPIMSVLPQRCMVYIKHQHPSKYEQTFLSLWNEMWLKHLDISKPDNLQQVLSQNFTEDEVKAIMEAAGKSEIKKELTDNTQEAIERGAFGAPFFWVTNSKGESEPFFGSDRFNHMWDFLELPVQPLAIIEKRANL